MLYLVKHVMEQYRPLIAKMHDDILRKNITIEKLSLLCDLELIYGLHGILPLLDCIYILIKFAQFRNVFVYDFIDVMKICQLEFYQFTMILTINLTTLHNMLNGTHFDGSIFFLDQLLVKWARL
jgi:hypothetical protein